MRRIVAISGIFLAAALTLLMADIGATGTSFSGPYQNGLIAFARCCGPETGIYLIRPDGRGERRLFAPLGDDAPLDPAWSPGGEHIALVPGGRRSGVWVMRGTGKDQRRITAGTGDALHPGWSPDGRWMVFSDIGSSRSGFHDVYLVRRNGSGLKRLTRAPADELMPAWAPNGREIVYGRDRDLWRMNADGSGQRRLTPNASSPSWSPGGTHIAFIRGGDPWVMARDGTGANRVADMRQQGAVAWSPDGRWLVTAPFDRGDLTLVRADGSQTRPLTGKSGYGHSWPSWQRRPS
ncbi:MAG: WD40-like beta Propeller containing protein [Gaiellaceae bacterium]|jgi:TolB protein|nr:WD40-like beta Propeller containing protein [Gaiellaceae bacterium]